MSRVGKKIIEIPANVKVEINNQDVKVSGPIGELKMKIDPSVNIEMKDGKILLSVKEKEYSRKTGAVWGLSRAILANMINGVTKDFEKKLQIDGVGYRAALEGADLTLNVGFTLPVKVKCPEGIKFLVTKNIITVSGSDKEMVGQVAAIIKKAKVAEPYQGKGIKYFGEKIIRKEGKKVVAAKK